MHQFCVKPSLVRCNVSKQNLFERLPVSTVECNVHFSKLLGLAEAQVIDHGGSGRQAGKS